MHSRIPVDATFLTSLSAIPSHDPTCCEVEIGNLHDNVNRRARRKELSFYHSCNTEPCCISSAGDVTEAEVHRNNRVFKFKVLE